MLLVLLALRYKDPDGMLNVALVPPKAPCPAVREPLLIIPCMLLFVASNVTTPAIVMVPPPMGALICVFGAFPVMVGETPTKFSVAVPRKKFVAFVPIVVRPLRKRLEYSELVKVTFELV